jgi:type IV secretory pathway TrbD component
MDLEQDPRLGTTLDLSAGSNWREGPIMIFVVGQMFAKNSKPKLWLFVLYLFDPKFLKMAPGTHNVAINKINRSYCADRTMVSWGGIHMRKISFFAGVVAVLVLVGVGTWIGVGKGTSTSALPGSAVNPSAMMTSAADLRTSRYDDYSVVFVELQSKR